MFKTNSLSFLKYNVFKFGDQHISQFVLFEYKKWFSIIFFYFHKSKSSQDRFHTHAFNAHSFKLWGTYDEHILNENLTEGVHTVYKVKPRNSIYQYFPRDSYHRISNSSGCATILFSGKWHDTWKEYINGSTKYYTWGRN